MEIINYSNLETLHALGSALTIEGLAESSYQELLDWIKNITPLKAEKVYVIKGKDMNEICNLTGNNAYPDDTSIVSVNLDDIENPLSLAIPRFQIGARWLDDIIMNNAVRERGDTSEDDDE